MQKLLRRTPSSATGPPINSLSLPLSSTTSSFLSLGFCNSVPKLHKNMIFTPTPTPLPHPVSTAVSRRLNFTKIPSSCHHNNTVPFFRSGVVLKESRSLGCSFSSGGRAWFTTFVKSKSGRRQRSNNCGPVFIRTSCDLLNIPRVGLMNLRKLVRNGFEYVYQLEQLYRDKFFGESSEKMVEYLQSSVGIIHKNHAESITAYIKERVDEELKENGSKPAQKKQITLGVEGNISVGKSTFLQRLANKKIEVRGLVDIVPEPVDKWQNVGPDHFNILGKDKIGDHLHEEKTH